MASSLCASQGGGPEVERARVVRLQRLLAGQREAAFCSALLDHRHRRQPSAGEDLGHDELDEAGQLERQRNAEFLCARGILADDRVQQHDAVVGQHAVGHLEEVRVAIVAEVLERADGHDPVDRLVELLPALQQHPLGARAVQLVERLLDVGGLVLRQRQADDVDVVPLDRPPHGGAPAAADVQQRHARFEAQFAQRQVDLGDLGLLERHVVTLEVCAAVRPRRVEEQREEVVAQVVVCLDVLEMRLEVTACVR